MYESPVIFLHSPAASDCDRNLPSAITWRCGCQQSVLFERLISMTPTPPCWVVFHARVLRIFRQHFVRRSSCCFNGVCECFSVNVKNRRSFPSQSFYRFIASRFDLARAHGMQKRSWQCSTARMTSSAASFFLSSQQREPQALNLAMRERETRRSSRASKVKLRWRRQPEWRNGSWNSAGRFELSSGMTGVGGYSVISTASREAVPLAVVASSRCMRHASQVTGWAQMYGTGGERSDGGKPASTLLRPHPCDHAASTGNGYAQSIGNNPLGQWIVIG
jgi:hypothetical protein